MTYSYMKIMNGLLVEISVALKCTYRLLPGVENSRHTFISFGFI